MSKNPQMDAARTEKRKQEVLECSFELFAKRGIESVTMPELAKAAGIDRSSIYRYFPNKADLAIAVSAQVWGRFTAQNDEEAGAGAGTAAERYEFWLESFLRLYRENRDMLRFNQFFNVYVANEKISAERMAPYTRVITQLKERFHDVYELAKQDGTLNTDIPEQKIVSTTLHLMLAAITRYAVGLVYLSDDSTPEEELTELKKMLTHRYVTRGQGAIRTVPTDPEGFSRNRACNPICNR